MGSGAGKKRDFGVHFGAGLRLETSSLWPFAKSSPFVFNEIVASVVSKNNLFCFLPPSLSGRPFDFPAMRHPFRIPGNERQTFIGYRRRVGMSSEKCGGQTK
jgi:hypothetical protein